MKLSILFSCFLRKWELLWKRIKQGKIYSLLNLHLKGLQLTLFAFLVLAKKCLFFYFTHVDFVNPEKTSHEQLYIR